MSRKSKLPKTAKPRLPLRLTDEQHSYLLKIANELGIPPGDLAHHAIAEYLANHKRNNEILKSLANDAE